MDIETRVLLGFALLPAVGLGAFAAGAFASRLIDYYVEGLARIVRSFAGLRGAWPRGAAVARDLARLAMFAAGALFWVSALSAGLLYPQLRWFPEGTGSLAFVIAVFTWIPAGFLQHVFEGRR